MKAILTKYLPATNTKGARVKAYDMDGNSATVPYDTRGTTKEAHTKAVNAFCDKLGWYGFIAGGAIKGGYAFICTAIREGDKA